MSGDDHRGGREGYIAQCIDWPSLRGAPSFFSFHCAVACSVCVCGKQTHVVDCVLLEIRGRVGDRDG